MHRFHKNYLNQCFSSGDSKRKVEELFAKENDSIFAPKKRRKIMKGRKLNEEEKILLDVHHEKIKEGNNFRKNEQTLLEMENIIGKQEHVEWMIKGVNDIKTGQKELRRKQKEKNKLKKNTHVKEDLEVLETNIRTIHSKIISAQKKFASNLKEYPFKVKQKEVTVGDLRSWVTPLVVPAKVLDKGPFKVVFLSKNDVSRLDVLNTLCHIESCTRQLSFVRVDANSNKDYILLQLLPQDLNLIQIGWTAQLMCYPKTRRHLSVPNFPWIIRCLMDKDPDVYLQGLQCFTKLFVYLHSYERYDEKVMETVKKLPQLLNKFGKEGGKYVWETKFFEHSEDEKSAFLSALQTFLLPPLNYFTDCMYINSNGLAILKDHLRRSNRERKLDKNESILWSFVTESEIHRSSKRENWFKFTLSKQELYSPFYNYILSESIDPNIALRLFFSVTNWRNIKKNSVKTSKKIYNKNMGKLDKQYFNIPCGKQVSFHTPEIQMMRMIQLLELNSTQETEDSSVGLMINDRLHGGCGSYLFTTAFNLRENFIPFAQLPIGFPKSLPATEVFPIHKFNFEAIKTNKSDTGKKKEVIKTRVKKYKNKNKEDEVVCKTTVETVFDEEVVRTIEESIGKLKKLSTKIQTKYDGKIYYN